MRAKLEYNLPEEKSDHMLAIKGLDMFCVLWDLKEWLRSQRKHNDKDFEEVEDKLQFLFEHYNIDLDELGG